MCAGSAISRVTRALAGLAIIAALGLAQHLADQFRPDELAELPAPKALLGTTIDTQIVRRILGVRLLVADLIWVDAMVKSDERHETADFTPIYQAFRAVTRLDPDNLLVFYAGGLYLSVVKDDIKGATALLREGVTQMRRAPYTWHGAWQIPFTLGYHLLFEEHEFEEGGRFVREAAEFEAAPLYVRKLAGTLKTEVGVLEVASRVLTDLHRRTTDEDARAKVEKKLMEIAVRRELLELNDAYAKFLETPEARGLKRSLRLQHFLRSQTHPGRDLLGRKLRIDPVSDKIVSEEAAR